MFLLCLLVYAGGYVCMAPRVRDMCRCMVQRRQQYLPDMQNGLVPLMTLHWRHLSLVNTMMIAVCVWHCNTQVADGRRLTFMLGFASSCQEARSDETRRCPGVYIGHCQLHFLHLPKHAPTLPIPPTVMRR